MNRRGFLVSCAAATAAPRVVNPGTVYIDGHGWYPNAEAAFNAFGRRFENLRIHLYAGSGCIELRSPNDRVYGCYIAVRG